MIYLLLLLLILSIFTVSAFADNQKLIVPGESIGGVKLGITRTEVIKILGNPKNEINTPGYENTIFLIYSHNKNVTLVICINKKNNKVFLISAESSEYKLSNGLSLGSSISSVEKLMGKGENCKAFEKNIDYPDKGIIFFLYGDKVQVIRIYDKKTGVKNLIK